MISSGLSRREVQWSASDPLSSGNDFEASAGVESVLERIMALLGLVDSAADQEEESDTSDRGVREERVLKIPPESAVFLIVRGREGVRRKEELAEALRRGKMLLVDLRGMEREVGQSLLDFLCGVAFANRGTVVRLAGGIFLAAPRKSMIEEWEEEDGA